MVKKPSSHQLSVNIIPGSGRYDEDVLDGILPLCDDSEPYYGSLKGSQQTLWDKGGNDVDLSSLLIALYRTSGIPSRYVFGTVEIPIDVVRNWVQIDENPAPKLKIPLHLGSYSAFLNPHSAIHIPHSLITL